MLLCVGLFLASSVASASAPFYLFDIPPSTPKVGFIRDSYGSLYNNYLSPTECPAGTATLSINRNGALQISGTQTCLTVDSKQLLTAANCAGKVRFPKFQVTQDGRLVDANRKQCIVNKNGIYGLENVPNNGGVLTDCPIIKANYLNGTTDFQMNEAIQGIQNVQCSRVDKNKKLVPALPTECPSSPDKLTKFIVTNDGKLQNVQTGLCYQALNNKYRQFVATPCKDTTHTFAIQNGTLITATPNTCLRPVMGSLCLIDWTQPCTATWYPIHVLTGCT